MARIIAGRDLKKLAQFYGTDKWGHHWYAQHYQQHFRELRRKRINLLEIGVGGHKYKGFGGESLRTWRTYFPNARIYGIDIFDKSEHNERRITTFQGSQDDHDFLDEVLRRIGNVHIIIDDGSHVNNHVLTSFYHLFPELSPGGWYVIEDLQTSYWKEYGGTGTNSSSPETSVGLIKKLIDGLHYPEFKSGDYKPSYLDKYVVEVHCYHNIAFLKKADANYKRG